MIELGERVRALVGPRAVAELDWRGRKEPLPLALPASTGELQELVRWAASERVRVAPVGLGSKLGWTRPPRDRDAVGDVLALSTRRLQRVVEYEPGEGVLTALAGTRMSTLRDLARAHGHWLTPDVPAAEGATLGGVLAANQSGFDRVRHGPVRHHVLGATVVLADGSLARSGGRLVKNVTGFDLQRLWCGSHGTLCVIVEAALRLGVAPREERWVTATAKDAAEACARVRAAANSALRPIALVAVGEEDAAWTLHAHLGGMRGALEHELGELLRQWPGARVLAGDEARAEAARVRELDPAAHANAWFRATCAPGRVERALALELAHPTWTVHRIVQPASGIADFRLVPRDGEKLTSDALGAVAQRAAERARAELGPGATFTLRNPTRRTAFLLPHLADTSPAALQQMRALKRALDPHGVFAGARFEEEL